MLSLFDNNFLRPTHHLGLALHRAPGFSDLPGLFNDAAARQHAFTNDLPDHDVEMADGGYSSSYSFSSSTITGPDGASRRFSRERFKDSSGRAKTSTQKQLGDRSWVQEERFKDSSGRAKTSTQ